MKQVYRRAELQKKDNQEQLIRLDLCGELYTQPKHTHMPEKASK